MPAETKVMPATRLALYDVTNLEGEDLGQVENFLLDMLEGRIAFLVVAFGGILGLTDKWFAIPWEIAAWSPQDRKFVVNMPRGILEKASGLDKRKWPQAVDLSWLTACYEHYGCAPYWERLTEEEVKRLAYSIWEQEGRPEGKDLEPYFRAEKIIQEQQARIPSRQFALAMPVQTGKPAKSKK